MKKYEQEGWRQLNQILRSAVVTPKNHPDKTTFLKELNTTLSSIAGQGFIDWEVMHMVDAELTKCRKAMGEMIPDIE